MGSKFTTVAEKVENIQKEQIEEKTLKDKQL